VVTSDTEHTDTQYREKNGIGCVYTMTKPTKIIIINIKDWTL